MLKPLLLLAVLIFLNATFASAEIAVISVNPAKIKKMSSEGNTKAKKLLSLTEEPARFLATIQVAITLAGLLQSAFAAENFADPLVALILGMGVSIPESILKTVSIIVITLILAYFNLVFGELIPKRIAMKKSEGMALGMAGMLYYVSKLFAPVVWLLTASTNGVLRLFGINPEEDDEQVTEDEILMMLEEGNEQGTILEAENEIIQNVFEFNDITAGDIATHRVDVDILWLDDDISVWAETIHKTRHTLYPVCEKSADDVMGVLNAKDYFSIDNKTKEVILKEAVHSAYFVPESIKADVLFRNMKETRNTLAIIMDERGGMEGIVTLFDLVEELVGELGEDTDEDSKPEPAVTQIDDKKWRIVGNISLEDLSEETGIDFENDEYDTFTGLVFETLGIIPSDGEQEIEVELPQVDVCILRVEAHQIDEAVITMKEEIEE